MFYYIINNGLNTMASIRKVTFPQEIKVPHFVFCTYIFTFCREDHDYVLNEIYAHNTYCLAEVRVLVHPPPF